MSVRPFISGRYLFMFFTMVAVGLSCNKEAPIPSYVHIDSFTLTTSSLEGSPSQKIVDAWIYVEDQFVGAFELPCTVPILTSGSHKIQVYPGIKENGMIKTRITYPFYNTFEQTILFTPGQIVNVAPTTSYRSTTYFEWREDFEGSQSICDSISSDTVMSIMTVPSEVFEGTGSGAVFLESGKNTYLGSTCNKYTLPQGGAQVFLELDYNCNTEFNIGVIGYDASGNKNDQIIALSLRPTTGWNKVYVNMSSSITNANLSSKFTVFFSMLKNSTISSSYMYLDNVKLVHFN